MLTKEADHHIAYPAGRPRVTCVIDTLDQGGAQRQLSMLAVMLTRRGYHVDVVTYLPTRFFDSVVEAAGIPTRRLPLSGKLQRALAVRRAIRDRDPDVVIAYLAGPSAYAELAGLPARRFGLIVTEFTVPDDTVRSGHRLRLAAHRLADVVVTETEHVRRLVTAAVPALAKRMIVIRNGVDLQEFRPRNRHDRSDRAPAGRDATRVLVLAGYRPQKNPFGMLAAMEHIRRIAPRERIELDWYGSTLFADGLPGVYLGLRREVRERALEDVFRLHEAALDAPSLYRRASLVCLPSFWEGCSNVICEAAASGVPMVVSDVCDNRKFVIDGVTGFLADPHSAESMARAILRFHRLSDAAKREMGRRARIHAEALFDPNRFAHTYATLIDRLSARTSRGPTKSEIDGCLNSIR